MGGLVPDQLLQQDPLGVPYYAYRLALYISTLPRLRECLLQTRQRW
jgi:hypothetical protein